MPTYTAMLALRGTLSKTYGYKQFWEEAIELNIYHLYPDVLNLYGDRGNVL